MKARMTLLDIIKNENKASSSRKDLRMKENEIFDTDEIVMEIAARMKQAARIIQNAMCRWAYTKWAKDKIFIADIYFDADYDIAENVFVVGDFTENKWMKKVEMQYSFYHRAFRARVRVHDGNQFKFIIDGTFICCPKYPMTYTQERYTNNVFKINQNKIYHERKHILSKISKDMRFGLIKDEDTIRMNSHIVGRTFNKSFKESHQLNAFNIKNLSSFSPDVKLCHGL